VTEAVVEVFEIVEVDVDERQGEQCADPHQARQGHLPAMAPLLRAERAGERRRRVGGHVTAGNHR